MEVSRRVGSIIATIAGVLFLSFASATEPDHVLLFSTTSRYGEHHLNEIWGDPRNWITDLWLNNTVSRRQISRTATQGNFNALAVHHPNRTVFWHNKEKKKIQSIKLSYNASHYIQTFSAPCSEKVYGLAFDWVSDNLYWTDSVYNWVVMAPSKQIGLFKIVVDSGLKAPHGIIVNPEKSRLIWADQGTGTIEQSDLTGGERQVIFKNGIARPTVLTQEAGWLYWKDTTDSRIMKMRFDGSNLQAVLTGAIVQSFVGIDVYADFLFACDSTNTLYIYNGTTSTSMSISDDIECYDVTMFAPEKQPFLPRVCDQAGCEHICVGRDDNTRADCQCHHLHVEPTETECLEPEEANIPWPAFFVANATKVYQVRAWAPDNSRVDLSKLIDLSCTALAPAHHNNEFYMVLSGAIQSVHLSPGSYSKTIIYGLVENTMGMAVDWWSGNLYWTMATVKRIMVATTEGRYAHVLRGSLRGSPYGLAVNPKTGQLFWAESYSGYHGAIWRASTDGNDAVALVENNVIAPRYLAIDQGEERLYWTDEMKNALESVTFSGSERQPLIVSARPYGIAVFQDYLAWTSQERLKTGVYWNRKGEVDVTRFIPMLDVGDIVLYGDQHQPRGTGPCSVTNGGCSQLCLPGVTGRTCTCAVGYTLNVDDASCLPEFNLLKDDYLIFIDSYRQELYQMDPSSGDVRGIPVDVSHDLPWALDIHPYESKLYWSDHRKKEIWSANLDGTNPLLIKSVSEVINGLAVDYLNDIMYYTDEFRAAIYAMNLKGQHAHQLIGTDLQKPTAIVLDVKNSVVYWTDCVDATSDHAAKIERANSVDGSNRTILVTHGLKQPTALDIDFKAGKMFWAESYFDKVEMSDLDGNNRRELLSHYRIACYGLAHDDLYLYIADINQRGILKHDIQNGGTNELGTFEFERLVALKMYDSSRYETRADTPTKVTSIETTSPKSLPQHNLNTTMVISIAVGIAGVIIIIIIIAVATVCCRKRRPSVTHQSESPPAYATPVNSDAGYNNNGYSVGPYMELYEKPTGQDQLYETINGPGY